MAISVRKGKMANSIKYKHPIGLEMTKTSWRLGIDKPAYETTSKAATREVWSATLGSTMPRIDKNASTDLFKGYAEYKPDEHFDTVTRAEHRATTYHKEYERTHPAPGFDRLTANRTNYALGSESAGWYTTQKGMFRCMS
jgi:hypothetical protein